MENLRTNQVLRRLLDENRKFELDGRGTTNHCPMVLCALAGMGASDARLEEFFAHWTRRHAVLLASNNPPITREDYPAQLGRKEAFASLRDCFSSWITEVGTDAIVREVLQSIPRAPASGAFHGMIRLAYGLEAAHAGEVAAGLAALVCGNLALDIELDGKEPPASVAAALADLSNAMARKKFTGDRITTRLSAVAADITFRATLPAPPQHADLFDQMAFAALAAYRISGNFTALHMVTGMHAARLVLARLPETHAAQWMPPLWVAFCAAYASIGAPRLSDEPANDATESRDWPALFARAVQSDDDHDIKFVYTCQQEDLHRPHPAYYAAAQQRLAKKPSA